MASLAGGPSESVLACPSPLILITPSPPGAESEALTLPRPELLRAERALLALAAGLGLRVIVSPVHGAVERVDMERCHGSAKIERLPRPTPDALQCAALFSAIDRNPNRVLVLAGVLTEVDIYLTALTAVRRGFEVHVLVDACAGANPRAEAAAFQTMAAQGVRLSSIPGLMTQLLRDVTTPRALVVAELVRREQHGVSRPARETP